MASESLKKQQKDAFQKAVLDYDKETRASFFSRQGDSDNLEGLKRKIIVLFRSSVNISPEIRESLLYMITRNFIRPCCEKRLYAWRCYLADKLVTEIEED